MISYSRRAAARWGLGTIVVLLLAVSMLATPVPKRLASATTYYMKIFPGVTSSNLYYSGAWHTDEAYCTNNSYACPAVDLTLTSGSIAGASVYFYTSGNRSIYVYAYDHAGYWTSCPGVDLWMSDASTFQSLGQEHYVHMTATTGIIGNNWSWTGTGSKYLGTVNSGQDCPVSTGPHLHQSGMETGYPLTHNTSLSGQGTLSSTTWLHRMDW